MTETSERRLSAEDSLAIGRRVREELARRRITRQRLADEAKISISTLEKALSGRRPFTLATIVRLEEALGAPLRTDPPMLPAGVPGTVGLAPDGLGSYSRPAVAWLEGAYLTIRPSFSEASAVYAYRTEIQWNEALSSLAFTEGERVDSDYTQSGTVSVPHQSGHIYFVTNKHGQYRLIIVSRPTIRGEMHGILTTLQAGPGARLTPVSTPIVLVPLAAAEGAVFGLIGPGHAHHTSYHKLLRRTVEETFAFFLGAPA